jgi:hypothetical protein
VAIDIQRVLQAAFEAATQQPSSQSEPEPRKPRLSAGKGLLLGAGVVTAGRLIAGSKGQELFGSLQQRIEEFVEEPEAEDEEDVQDEEQSEEPEGEAEEDFEDEEDFEEPEGEDEEDFEDEEDEEERPRSRRTRRVKTRGRG